MLIENKKQQKIAFLSVLLESQNRSEYNKYVKGQTWSKRQLAKHFQTR